MKMRFHSHVNETHFHMKGWAPGLALIERFKATREWAIGSCLACVYRVMDARGKFGEHERKHPAFTRIIHDHPPLGTFMSKILDWKCKSVLSLDLG